MKGHQKTFKEELKKILSNVKGKHTPLRKEIIKTCQVLENENLPVFPIEVCCRLIDEVVKVSSLSSAFLFLPFIDLLLESYISDKLTHQILAFVEHTIELPRFSTLQNEQRIQKTLGLLTSKQAFSLENIETAQRLTNAVCWLVNSRSKEMWQQSTRILVEMIKQFCQEVRSGSQPQKNKLFEAFINSLLRILLNETPKWLTCPSDSFFMMAVLLDCLADKYIEQNKSAFCFGELIPVLRRMLKELHEQIKGNPTFAKGWEMDCFSKIALTLKFACEIGKIYEQHFELLEQILNLLMERQVVCLKVIGYDATNSLFESAGWMEQLMQSCSCGLFHILLTTHFNTVKSLLQLETDLTIKGEMERSVKQLRQGQWQHIDMTPSIQIKNIVRNMEQMCATVYGLYGTSQRKPPIDKTYQLMQKTVFEIVKAILHNDMSEDTLHGLLKMCEVVIHLSGVLGKRGFCANFIKLLCKYCLPTGANKIEHRHVQINMTILNTANALGSLFSTTSWATVWKALENYTLYYNRYLASQNQLRNQRKSDVQILYDSMDSIFTNSPQYSDFYLITIIRSLVEVTYECLENNYAQEPRKVFAFERIHQIYKLNLFRIPSIWPQLSSSLLILTTSKFVYFRLSALTLLNTLIPLSLQYLKTHPQTLKYEDESIETERKKQESPLKASSQQSPVKQESPPHSTIDPKPDKCKNEMLMTMDNYEQAILEPWVNLAECQYMEIKNQLAVAVNKMIIDYGHIMTNGWKCLLEVLAKIEDLRSLQAIIEIYLDKIEAFIPVVIDVIDRIERKLTETNQKYLCLTLIWAIGDHCHKQAKPDLLRKIYELLLRPDETFILGTEARHSSFYILAELIVHNCLEDSQQFWAWLFQLIRGFYQYALSRCLLLKDKNICEQVLKNMLANLIKIYRKLFTISREWPREATDCHLKEFYLFGSQILEFRQGEIYQTTLKQMRDIILLKIDSSLRLSQFFGFLSAITEIYFVENDPKILKSLIAYLPPDIYEIVGLSLPKISQKFTVVYRLIEKVLLLRLEAEEKDIRISQLRIFFEQKTFFDFWRKMHTKIMTQPSMMTEYLESLNKTLHKLVLYSDYTFLSKLLPYSSAIISQFPSGTEHLPTLELLSRLLNLRNGDKLASKQIPIWYIAAQELIKLGYIFEKEWSEAIEREATEKLLRSYWKVWDILNKLITLNCVTHDASQDYWTHFHEIDANNLRTRHEQRSLG